MASTILTTKINSMPTKVLKVPRPAHDMGIENFINQDQETKEITFASHVDDYSCAIDTPNYLVKMIMTEFQQHLIYTNSHSLGYPVNLNCNHFVDLSPLLRFSINNAGDPFTGTTYEFHSRKFEVSVLDWFAKLWEIEKDEYWGYVTNGGTEGNLHGLLLGRELLSDGILYTSSESHYSIFKAARMYRMECEVVGALATGEIDYTDLKAKLLLNKDKPAIVNVNIGTTFKGGIDDLDLVIEALEECGFSHDQFYIHCDAALSGLIIPFLRQPPKVTFKKPIGSISISAHKFLGSPMPCGVQITRKRHIDIVSQTIEYISSIDSTISGSRNGHTPIFMWYALKMKKSNMGLQRDVEKCLNKAQYLHDKLVNAGISTMCNKSSIVVVFERPLDYEFIRYWQLSCQGNMAHVVVMPHVTIKMLDDFVDDLFRKRKIWYRCGKVRPPCLAEDIGISRCTCTSHGN